MLGRSSGRGSGNQALGSWGRARAGEGGGGAPSGGGPEGAGTAAGGVVIAASSSGRWSRSGRGSQLAESAGSARAGLGRTAARRC